MFVGDSTSHWIGVQEVRGCLPNLGISVFIFGFLSLHTGLRFSKQYGIWKCGFPKYLNKVTLRCYLILSISGARQMSLCVTFSSSALCLFPCAYTQKKAQSPSSTCTVFPCIIGYCFQESPRTPILRDSKSLNVHPPKSLKSSLGY